MEIRGDEQRDRSYPSIRFLDALIPPVSMRCALGSETLFVRFLRGATAPAATVSSDFPVTFIETRERRNARKPLVVTKSRGRERRLRKTSGEIVANLWQDAITRDASRRRFCVCNKEKMKGKRCTHLSLMTTPKRRRKIIKKYVHVKEEGRGGEEGPVSSH